MWFLFQLMVMCCVVYIYTQEIPDPNDKPGYILYFAYLVAYALTWLLSKLFDLLRGLRRLISQETRRPGVLQQPGSSNRVHSSRWPRLKSLIFKQ